MKDMAQTMPANQSNLMSKTASGSQGVGDKYIHQLIADVFLITLDPPKGLA